jgi:hypothetical protein
MGKKYTILNPWPWKPENIEGAGGISTETGLIEGAGLGIDGGTTLALPEETQ